MLQLAGKADETSKSRAAQRGAVSVACVSVQRARKDPGADPGSCIAHHAAEGL